MTIKFSQLPVTTNLATPANILFPVVDTSGPTSFTTALTTLSAQILSGNAATATKLQTARTINGVSFDGTANISITASVPTASTTVLGAVKVDGTTVTINGSGVISATPPQSTMVHAFAFDVNNNLIYTKTTGQTFDYTTDGQNSTYSMVDIGTDIYNYSIDANGNLLATFSS
jgi:hypothetical protein